MLALLLSELPAHKEQLQQTYNDGDLQALARYAHMLHGSAAYCGVPHLKECVARLEQEARRHKIEHIALTLNETLDAINELLRTAD